VLDDLILNVFQGFIFLSPAFFANSAAVFTSGLGPVDRGKMWKGKPILGKNKTTGGVLGATLSGGLLGIVIVLFYPEIFAEKVKPKYDGIDFKWYFGFVLGFSALIGDAIGSFIKRRIDLKPGGPFPIVDQVGFVVSSFLIISIFASFPLVWFVLLVPAALVLHLVANIFAYKMGWKNVWW